MVRKTLACKKHDERGFPDFQYWGIIWFTVVAGKACVQSVRRDMHYTHLPHPFIPFDAVIMFVFDFVAHGDWIFFDDTYFRFRRQWLSSATTYEKAIDIVRKLRFRQRVRCHQRKDSLVLLFSCWCMTYDVMLTIRGKCNTKRKRDDKIVTSISCIKISICCENSFLS